MKLFYCLLLLVCPFVNRAQPGTNIKPISVGEQMPPVRFAQMLNYSRPFARLDQFKGKIVLLDFWGSWCGACLKKLDLLDSLQRRYADKLQILLISSDKGGDTKEKLTKFFNNRRNARNERLVLPAVYNDSILRKYFPHDAVPHIGWLDKEQKCIAITNSTDLTTANVEMLINDRLPVFNCSELMNDFHFDRPLFIDGNGGNGDGIIFRSTLSRYIPGMTTASRYTLNKEGLTTHYTFINTPVIDFVKSAYVKFTRNDRVVLEVDENLRKMLLPDTDSASKLNAITYELITEPVKHVTALAYIKRDIERYFGLSAKTELRPADCYVMTADSTLLLQFETKGEKQANHLFDKRGRYMRNRPLKTLAFYLNEVLDKYVVLKTNLTGNYDIQLPDIPLNDIESLKSTLGKIGITLTTTKENVEQFIIYQKPKQPL